MVSDELEGDVALAMVLVLDESSSVRLRSNGFAFHCLIYGYKPSKDDPNKMLWVTFTGVVAISPFIIVKIVQR